MLPIGVGLAVTAVVMGTGVALLRPWRRYREDGSERSVRWIGAILPIGGMFVFYFVQAAMSRGSFLAAMVSQAPMLLMFAAFACAVLTVRRVGNEPRCAKCEYAMDLEVKSLQDRESRCPECGSFWNRSGGSVQGRKRKSPLMIAAASAFGALCIASMTAKLSMRAMLPRILPTSSLIREVTAAPRGFTMDEWAALSTRTLTAEQKLLLADGLLELRTRRQYLSRDAEAWFEAAVLARELPSEIAQRYFRGMLDVWIDAPDRAAVGETISIGIGSEHHGSLGTPATTRLRAFVVFAGFSVDDGPLRHGLDRAAYAINFGRVYRSFGKLERDSDSEPRMKISPESQGTLHIRAEYWLVFAPVATAWAVSFGPDGTPVVPPGTVWCEKVVVDRSISVSRPARDQQDAARPF